MTKIKYYGFLKKFMPEVGEDGFWDADAAGTPVRELFENTGVKYNEIRMTILVNKSRKDVDYVLQDGDIMTVMPLVAGG